MDRLLVTLCNLLWLLSCVPGWVLFVIALRRPRQAQERILRHALARNRSTAFGRHHGFASIASPDAFRAAVPPAEYEDLVVIPGTVPMDAPRSQRVECLVPTSGSSGRHKLIPYTARLRGEFRAALDPWIAWLFLARPGLLAGRHYWSVSPNTLAGRPSADVAGVPVGFADDADYLGPVGRHVARVLLVTPPGLCRVTDQEAFTRLSLYFLLRERNLRLVSVWHPSFLTLLLDAIPRHLDDVLQMLRTGSAGPGVPAAIRSRVRPMPQRAHELEALDLAASPSAIRLAWPHLKVISCWTDGRSEPWMARLRRLFPGVAFQPKGLLATEGVVSIPTGCGRFRPCAIRSHYYEFIEPGTGLVKRAWELSPGTAYSVLLTTGGGLWRYRLHDLVRVDGFCGRTPSLTFIGRDNGVSDLVGEKLHEEDAAAAMAAAAAVTGVQPLFALLEPELRSGGSPHYTLRLDLPSSARSKADLARFAAAVDNLLRRNCHYDHARNLGQLGPLVPCPDTGAAYRSRCEATGTPAGAVKFPALRPAPSP